MNITTQESHIQSSSLASKSASTLPPPRRKYITSQSKPIFFWLLALSVFYVVLQYEEIANLVGAGNNSRTQSQTLTQNIATNFNNDGNNYDNDIDSAFENGFINSNISPQVISNDSNDHDNDHDHNNTYSVETDNNHNEAVNSNILPISNSSSSPKLLETDVIYQRERWADPIVIHKYKLIFYPIPKVACTDWKLLFRRMEGKPEWNTTDLKLKILHDPTRNNLTTLSQLPIDEAQHILTSSEWTRAVVLREPKERILSAYLDKYMNNNIFFRKKCCQPERHNITSLECKKKRETDPELAYFLNRTRDCPNDHWNPQYTMIDAKWWNTVNFVGYMHNIVDDAKRLLQSVTSTEDGVSAWEQYGRTGWGDNETNAFMERDTAHHATNAHDKLKSFYTREDEKFVEKYWKGEWNHTVYHFASLHLYDSNTTNSNDM